MSYSIQLTIVILHITLCDGAVHLAYFGQIWYLSNKLPPTGPHLVLYPQDFIYTLFQYLPVSNAIVQIFILWTNVYSHCREEERGDGIESNLSLLQRIDKLKTKELSTRVGGIYTMYPE
ncbi:hypothetical protein BDZ94DRAFT_62731 [Collybia nuda]|uniref:Uncharacterized protein n=1 Tax=Collybia nuda TaxID=64659 RepID=A0A9P5YG43_9AGAR|nr:hypothetical protein BDZ94DRAFT_62731 [Collybia nuda]